MRRLARFFLQAENMGRLGVALSSGFLSGADSIGSSRDRLVIGAARSELPLPKP